MTDYSRFRKTPDQIDWMRAPQAQHFVRELVDKRKEAHDNLMATCAKSDDPRVTGAFERWHELDGLVTFLGNARKERTDE